MSAAVRIFFLLSAVLPWARGAERELVRTFPVQPGCTLKIDTYRGHITVEEHDAAEIAVMVHMEIGADTEEEADRVRETLQFEVTAENKAVSIRVRNPRETGVRFAWREQNEIDFDFKISVPRQCHVDLATRRGNITVGNLAGRHTARVESGTIFFRRIEGSVDAKADSGEVIVSRCSGAVTLRVLKGTIRTGTLGGRADLRNDNGDIEVLGARASITAVAVVGDVAVGFPKSYAGDSQITTSGGSIYAKIDPAANCLIDASSVWGHVESKLPLTVESGALGKSKLTARLNSGGPRLTLRADGGHVKISALDTGLE